MLASMLWFFFAVNSYSFTVLVVGSLSSLGFYKYLHTWLSLNTSAFPCGQTFFTLNGGIWHIKFRGVFNPAPINSIKPVELSAWSDVWTGLNWTTAILSDCRALESRENRLILCALSCFWLNQLCSMRHTSLTVIPQRVYVDFWFHSTS